MSKKHKSSYHKPDGTSVTYAEKYLDAWYSEIINPLKSRIPGISVVAFDPELHVRDTVEDDDNKPAWGYRSAELPLWLARRIIDSPPTRKYGHLSSAMIFDATQEASYKTHFGVAAHYLWLYEFEATEDLDFTVDDMRFSWLFFAEYLADLGL